MAARGRMAEMGLREAVVAGNYALKLGDTAKLGLEWREKRQRPKKEGHSAHPDAADQRWCW